MLGEHDVVPVERGPLERVSVTTTDLAVPTADDWLLDFFSATKYAEALQDLSWDFRKELSLYHEIVNDPMTPAKDRMRAAEKIREVGKDILRMTGKIVDVVAKSETHETRGSDDAATDVVKRLTATTSLLRDNLNSKQTIVVSSRIVEKDEEPDHE